MKKHIPFIFLTSVVIYLLSHLLLFYSAQKESLFNKRPIPDEYKALKDYIASQKEFFRTAWVPTTQRYYYFSLDHPAIDTQRFFQVASVSSVIKELTTPSGKQSLKEAGVKYIIVPSDPLKELYLTDRMFDEKQYENIISLIAKIPWLKQEKSFGKIVVYTTDSYNTRFWFETHEQKFDWKRINQSRYTIVARNGTMKGKLIFSEGYDPNWVAVANNTRILSERYHKYFNSFTFEESSQEITISYAPQSVVNIGLVVSLATLSMLLGTLVFITRRRAK